MIAHENKLNKARVRSLALVTLMLGSIFVAMIPAVSASHVETYPAQRNPVAIASGDLDCDGDADIVSASEMGMLISVMYNEDGDFSDREDLWVSANTSRRAHWFDMANANQVGIGDIDDDGANDLVFFRQNVWVAGSASPPLGNMSVIWGDCDERVSDWSRSAPISVSPYLYDLEIVDVNDDGKDDIVGLFLDETITNMEIMVMRGPNPTQQTSQSITSIPLTHAFYYEMKVGNWGESVQGGGIPGGQGDCEDQDIWMMTAPPYNGPQTGFSAGNWDNVTVLEYNCVTNVYENPTVQGNTNTHVFPMNENQDANGFDIADSNADGIIDMVAMGQGWDQNVSYATRTSVGGVWATNNLAHIGEYVASDVSIADINGDGAMDFLVPTMLTVTTVNSASAGQQQQLTTDNLRDINTVNIILNDGQGGYLSPQTFDVGRRPTMVIADQFSGGANSALDLAVGQRDYAFSYSNGAMWIDSKGWAGSMDTISIVELDSEDVGIGGVTVYPASYDYEDQEMKIGAGTRNVNVTVRNTGLQAISGSVDVDVSVKEVVGGTDTVVYANDFDTAPTGSCSNCNMVGVSYSGEVSGSYWHVEDGGNNSGNGDEYEADTNPTDYMWAGALVTNTSGDGDVETGYMSWWDEGLIIEDVDLTGADSASMDLDMMCMVQFSMIYYSSTGIANRIIYDDSCNIDVYSEDSGWSTVDYVGGYDYDRYVHLANGYYPEFTVSNSAYCCFVNPWDRYAGDSGVDLTPWAGETVDIRFRFRSGHMGSVGNDNASHNHEWDGFAIDNLSINKTVTSFGSNVQNVNQQLTLNNLAPGDEQVVTLNANFVNGTTYIIESQLTSTSGFSNGDDTNDDSRWRTTVKNLFDPSVEEITSFEKNELLASGNYPIDVTVKNVGNTVVDFGAVASVYTATPNDILIEDFEGGASGYAFGDDGDGFGVVLNDADANINNNLMPNNRAMFGSSAYWFGHPDDGYGQDWDEEMTLQTIDLRQNTADFVYMNFDYFADSEHTTDSEGDLLYAYDVTYLLVEWRKGNNVYNGTVLGNWNDYDEDGVKYNETCDDNSDDGVDNYDEVERIGDMGQSGFFNSEGISKGVTLDLTHIWVFNTTSLDSRDWDYNCSDLSGSEVTLSFAFQSGSRTDHNLPGFAVDNITVREYVFTYVTEYSTQVNGLDSQEDLNVNIGSHDFSQGIYRIDAMTHYDNQTQGTAWYNHQEVNIANNVSRVIFQVASVDVQLLRPDVLDCVGDNTYACVYPIDQVEDHAFTMELVNGVLEGDYNIKLKVTDTDTGSIVYNEASAESPMTLSPHQRSSATWAAVSPSSGWDDGGNYNFSFYAELAADGTISGNTWDFPISMADSIDVAILSDPTDQNRLNRVKEDLDAMGMTYTQFQENDWTRYITSTWMNHYDKILLPWQPTINVEGNDGYYTLLNTQGPLGLTPMDVIKNRMQAGATLEMHLGPYRSVYEEGHLPFDINVALRNVEGNQVEHSDTMVMDWHHPLLADVNPVALISFNGGDFVAESTLITTQTENVNIPQVCGGTISAPIGTFHSLITDNTDSTASLLATCSSGQGGMIITTIDVENPQVSDAYGTIGKPLLSNLLAHQVTPYPLDFGPAGDGFDMVINGEVMTWNGLQGQYDPLYMKSDAELEFDFTATLEGLDADWELRPVAGTTATDWDGNPLQDGESDHREEDTHTAEFCVLDAQSSTLCKQEARWQVTLYLHDAEGHTRIAHIMLETNDALADEFNPLPSFTIIDRLEYRGQIELHEDSPKVSSDGSEWDINLIRLGPTGDLTVHFDASNSSDGDATDGTNGIKTYVWTVFLDNAYNAPGSAPQNGKTTEISSMVSHSFTHRFENITVDPATNLETHLIRIELTVIDQADKQSLQSDKYKMYFVVVGEDFGDDQPVVEFTSPANGSSQTQDTLYVNGSLVSGSEDADGSVTVEVALADTTLDLLPSQKFQFKNDGTYDAANQLADGETFSLTLDIADLYDANGSVQTIFIKITEDDGSRWTITKSIDVNLVPRDSGPDEVDCDATPDDPACNSTSSGGDSEGGMSSLVLFGGIGALVLVIVILLTMFLVRGRGGDTSTGDAANFGGDVAEMDPVEAYVQQLVAQGYPEETARAYAQQYYAQAAQQQQQ